jgi:large subunit ribosomal protein L18e
MKTKSKIEKQLKRKTNNELVETIIAAKKKQKWLEIANILSGPRKNRVNLNLEDLEKEVKEGEIVIVAGKVLSKGNLSKKAKIVAIGFSENAKEKLLNSKIEVSSILEEIKKNPEAKGVRILKQ